MKTKSPLFRLDRLLLALATLLAATSSSLAVDLYWDANGGTAGTGGTGVWTTGTNTWRTNSGAGTLGTWLNTGSNNAYFEGTAGTVTLTNVTIALGGGTAFFNVDGYTLTATSDGTTRTLNGNLSIGNGLTLTMFGSANTSARLLAVGGNISGGTLAILSGANTAANPARLSLTAANSTVSSALVMSNSGAGTVQITSGGNGVQVTGTVSITGNAAVGAAASSTLTFSSTAVISGTGNLQFQTGAAGGGTGTLIFNSQSTYTGETRFNAGANSVARLGTNNALSTNSAVIMGFSSGNGGILDLNGFNQTFTSLASGAGGVGSIRNSGASTSTLSITGSANTTFGLVISNATSAIAFSRSGSGTTTLSGVNRFTGGTTLSGGGITLSGSGTLGGSGNAVTVSGGTLNLGGSASVTNASLTISGGVLTNGTFNAPSYALNGGTIAGNLGAGTINVGGNAALNGTAAATAINVNSGTLTLGSASRFTGTTPAVTIAGGALALGGNESVGSLTISSGTLSGSGVLTAPTYALNGGTVSGNLGAGTINVGGDAALNGTASATAINVNSGTLTLGSASRFVGTTPAVTMAGGTLTLGGAESIGSLTGSSGTVALGANTLTVGAGNASSTYSSGMTGTGGGLTKTGNGVLTLAANSSYTGATTINAGSLVYNGTNTSTAVAVNSGGTLTGSGSVGSTTINSGGTMNPGNSPGTQTYASLAWEGGANYNWQLYNATGSAGTDYDTFVSTGAFTINATSGNKFNINLWTLSGIAPDANGNALNFNAATTQTWTLGTFVSISGFSADAFALNTFATNGTGGFANFFTGTFSIDTNATSLLLVYTAPEIGDEFEWSAGAGNWDTAGNWTNNSVPPATGAKIYYSGAGGLSTNDVATEITGLTFKSGAGAYTLVGDALTIDLLGVVNNSTAVQTVDLNLTLSANQSLNAASGDLAIGGAVALGENTLTVTGDEDTSVTGAISGDGGLVKTGAGNLTLGGLNTYLGGTLVSGGALIGTTTSLQGGITNASFLEFSQATNGTYAGIITGAGLVVKSGAGTVTFSGANDYEGGTLVDEGTLTGSTSSMPGAVEVSSGATFAISQSTNGTFSGLIEGAGRFVKDGSGDVTLSGANTYSGGTLVSTGTLTGTASSLQGDITNNAAVVFAQTPTGAYGGAMSGTGSLTKSGAGSLTLSGANSYSGGTLVSAGALVGSTTSLQGTITNSATVVMSQAGNGTFDGTMTGAGGFIKAGAGTVTLGNNSGYSGAIDLQAGGLIAANNSSLGSSAVTMTNGSIEAASGVTIGNNFTIGTAGSTNTGGNVFVAGWDFQTTANGGTALVASPNTPKTILANFGDQAGAAAIYLNGSNGSFNFGSDQLSAFGGTGLNATNTFVSPTVTMSTTTTGAASLAVINVGGTANDQRIVFTLDMSGLKDLELSYASQRTATGFTSQVWSYSTDAVTWTSFYTNSTVATSFAITNAATLAAMNNAGNVYIGLTLSGAATGSQNNRLDNIVMNAVEETITPSTGTGTLGIIEAGSATFGGNVAVNNTASFTAAAGGQATFSGVVSGSGTTLSKTGAGTVTLSGSSANTFTGTTTVSAGTLELAKTADTTAIAGNLVVSSGATLLLSESNQVSSSGTTVSLSGGTITRASGVSEVFGALTLGLTGGTLNFGTGDIGTLGFGTYAPSALLTVQNFFEGNVLSFGSNLTSTINNGSLFSFDNSFTSNWNGSTFTITAIPEPSTYLAAAGLLSLMLWPSRKRLLKDAKKILGFTPPMRDRLAARRS
jgi:autotransporter-associated beta strand protein